MTTQDVRYSRLDPELRKARLIDATLACLKRYGFQGASIRKICAEAGVSVGLINHHYASKDELVAEAYLAITGRVMSLLRAAIDAASPSPRARLSAANARRLETTVNVSAGLAFLASTRMSRGGRTSRKIS